MIVFTPASYEYPSRSERNVLPSGQKKTAEPDLQTFPLPPTTNKPPRPGEEQRAPGGDGAYQRGAPQEEHPWRRVPEGGGQAAGQRREGVRLAGAFSRWLRPCHGPNEVGFLFHFLLNLARRQQSKSNL